MEWEPIVAVLIFIAGLAWGRYDGDRRERRTARAAAAAAFEQFQRQTHLDLQEALRDMSVTALAIGDRLGEPDELMLELNSAYLRVEALSSRLADEEARTLTEKAFAAVYDMLHAETDPRGKPPLKRLGRPYPRPLTTSATCSHNRQAADT